jgi:hypothetical protein
VDVVEPVVKDPLLFTVVDQELAVWWDLLGLDGTQVSSDNASGWVLVGEFDGPDTRSAADIKHIQHLTGNGCSVKFAIECQSKGVVLKVESVHFGLRLAALVAAMRTGSGVTSSFGTGYFPSAYAWYRRPCSYRKLKTDDVADIV